MAQRSIRQEQFGFAERERAASSLDALVSLIDWSEVAVLLDPFYSATKGKRAIHGFKAHVGADADMGLDRGTVGHICQYQRWKGRS